MTDLIPFNMNIQDIVSSLNDVIHAANPHLKGRLIVKTDIGNDSDSFKIMKRVRSTVYYFNPLSKKNTQMLTVQEVMRMPEASKDVVMEEFSKRFLVTVFMWTSSELYNELISGKFDIQQSSD